MSYAKVSVGGLAVCYLEADKANSSLPVMNFLRNFHISAVVTWKDKLPWLNHRESARTEVK